VQQVSDAKLDEVEGHLRQAIAQVIR